jgi:CRISPR/Cas system CSM-associated protein Csm3 (group 7 of RAMP superfamily)
MRDAAAEILGANRDLINRVFGSEFAESPWVWSSAQPTRGGWPATSVRARVSIDEETHSVLEDRIMFAEILEPTVPATFEIHLRGSLMDQERMVHMRLLLCAAAAVKHLGAERRRGLGSVTVQGDREITSDDIAIIRNRGSVDV